MKVIILLIVLFLCCIDGYVMEKKEFKEGKTISSVEENTTTDNPVGHYLKAHKILKPIKLLLIDLNADGINDVLVSHSGMMDGEINFYDIYITDNNEYRLLNPKIDLEGCFFYLYESHPKYKLFIWADTGRDNISFIGYSVEKIDGEWKVIDKKLEEINFPNALADGQFLWDYLQTHKEPLDKHYIEGDEAKLLEFWKKDRITQADKIAAAEKKLQEEAKPKAPDAEKKAQEGKEKSRKP